jgi:lactate dehydrogenase-like 2-hydroxyacid dehydrogenase
MIGAFMSKRHILTFETYDNWDVVPMEAEYCVHNLPYGAALDTLPEEAFDKVEAFAFRGHGTLDAQIIDAFPKLGMIANYGVGYDTIEVAYATAKGIQVSNTPDVLTEDVADLAVGMVIAQSRGMVGASDWIRSGNWAKNGAFGLQRKVSGKRVGIVGLGRIGRAVAERLAPFRCDLHYYARATKDTPGWTHHDNIVTLAKAVEIMVICVSGGPETRGIVGKDAIEALGPDGLLVNASRGTTVDENALLDALESGALGAAGLDVFLNEPHINPRFLQLSNVLLQPHQSSGTIETRKVMGQLQRDNLAAFFAGKPLITPVN